MAWFINSAFNNGYPWNDSFPSEFLTSFTSEGVEIPYGSWRIANGTNNGYPWVWWWFKESADVGDGDMNVGGTADNYPNGFTTHDIGGVDDQFNDDDMGFNTDLVGVINTVFAGALDEKILGLSTGDFQRILGYLNDPSTMGPNYDPSLIQKMYGANIYDGVLTCRLYPFDVLTGFYSTCYPSIFGIYRLYSVAVDPQGGSTPVSETAVGKVDRVVRGFHMGSLSLDIFQAWEVENISYSIFLPCAGVFPLDVRDGSEVEVMLYVDILSGVGEYTVKQNGQVTGIYKVNIGVDVPINLTQGQISSNHSAFVSSQIARVASMAAPVAGAVNPAAGVAMGIGANVLGQMSGQMGGHLDISTPSVGSDVGMASYPYARIIAKIPKMFKGAYGYHETVGANRSTAFVRLDSCSGFVQCKNYACNVANATDEEKQEIERLLNSGVFI